MANKRIDIDPEQVRKLAALGCTHQEIADVIGCSHDTLTRRFKSEIEHGKANAKASLRRKQWETALAGNVPMLIWLGKQYLGQSDKLVTETTEETTLELSFMPLQALPRAEKEVDNPTP